MKLRIRRVIKIPSRFDAFMRDYRIAMWSTCGFVLVLVLLFALRTYERSILSGVLSGKKLSGSDYAKLLSLDDDVELQKNDTVPEENKAQAEQPKPATSLTIDSTGTSSGGTVTGGGETSLPDTGGSGTTDPPPPPPEPFRAELSGFGLRQVSGPFICSNQGGSGFTVMCMNYGFQAGIKTFNGPGTVSHKLIWAGPGSGELPGGFAASAGDVFTQVTPGVNLPCTQQGQYNFRFIITAPNVAESHNIPVGHYCTTTGG
jgi:hypothetical protein